MKKAKTKSAKPKTKSAKRAMPHFGKAPEQLVRTFENAMKDFPMAQQRKAFGFPAAFMNGNMFAGLFNDKMIVRLPAETSMALPNAKPFEPMPGRPMRGWVIVPPQTLGTPKELNTWLEKAMEFAKTLPAKTKKK